MRQAEEGLSLAEQERQVRAHIEQKGWDLDKIYVEEGVSGRKDDRPELAKLLATLNALDFLVIPKLDRLGRSNKHLHETFEALENANVALVSLKDNIDTSTATGKLMRAILSALAEFESDLIGERVESVVAARAEGGSKHAQFPFGYSADGKPVEPAANVVRRVFREAGDGVSQRQIAVNLNRSGIKTSKGKTWGQSQVKAVLNNVTHIGKVETNGKLYGGAHKAIITQKQWDLVQGLRVANKRGKNRSSAGRRPKGLYLFAGGLLRCAHCGAAMIAHTTTSGHESYNCNTRKETAADACQMHAVPRKALDSAVFEYFQRVCVDIEATKDELQARVTARDTESKARLREAKAKVSAATAASENLERDYLAGDLDAKGYTRLSAKRDEEVSDAEGTLGELEVKAKSVEQEPQSVADTAALIAALRSEVAGEVKDAPGLDGVRARLRLLFDRFEIGVGTEDDQPRTAKEAAAMAAQASGGSLGLDVADEVEVLNVDKWVVVPVPREEWIGELDGYWQSILRPMSLPINESGSTVADY